MEKESALGAAAAAVRKKVSKRDVIVFLSALALVLVIHLFAFTNKLINHDDLSEMFTGGSFLPSGRWLLDPVLKLTGRFSSPLVNGVVGSMWLALAVVFTVRLFRMRSLLASIAVAAAMAAFPTVTSTWAYMFTAPAYFFAMLLAALGACLIRGRGWARFAAGAGAIAVAMGCYQAYFGFAAALSVMSLLVEVCSGTYERPKVLLLDVLRAFLGLVLGMAAYLVILRLCLWVTGTELLSYAGLNGMTDVSLSQLIDRAVEAYRSFFRFPFSDAFLAVHRSFPFFMRAFEVLTVLTLLVLAVRHGVYRSPVAAVMALALLAVLPLAVNIVYVMAGAENVHWLMIYPNVLLWFLPAVLADRTELPASGRLKRAAAGVAACFLLAVSAAQSYEGALIANKAYLEMELTARGANAYLTRLVSRVEQTEGYEPGMGVAFIGNAYSGTALPKSGLTGVFLGDELMNVYSRGWLFYYFQSFTPGYVPEDQCTAIRETPEFKAMPCYPADGSISKIDGVLVVKLSA